MSNYVGPTIVRHRGRVLLEAQNARLRVMTGNASVFTAHKGFAGKSRGAPHAELSVDSAVPGDGFEVDWPALALAQDDLELEVELPGVATYGLVGDIRDVDVESDASAGEARPTKVSFNYTARVVSIA